MQFRHYGVFQVMLVTNKKCKNWRVTHLIWRRERRGFSAKHTLNQRRDHSKRAHVWARLCASGL